MPDHPNRVGLLAVLVAVCGILIVGGAAALYWFFSTRPSNPMVDQGPGQAVELRPLPPPGFAAGPGGRPSPEREGQEWTIDQMIDYLRSQGLDESYFVRDSGGAGSGDIASVRLLTAAPEADPRHTLIGVIRRYDTAERARQAAEGSQQDLQWGKFVFELRPGENPKASDRLKGGLSRVLFI
jgi:hypothetical protein